MDGDAKQEYFLEEFGKLRLPYAPERIGVHTGSKGEAYVLLAMNRELVVFII